MLYKPNSGQIKDGCMVYKDGVFYLFSMYKKENSEVYNNIWLATSGDGVHFSDYGCVVEDFPDYIWAMKIYQVDDMYYMNSGSFSKTGQQAVLKFWKSNDLLNWIYCPEMDIVAPESEKEGTRLDCMNVVKYNNKYYGYATGQCSFLESDDGIHWKIMPSNIDYKPFPVYNKALGGFEVADCIELNDHFYLLCGGFGHLGMSGYGVYVYESEYPLGPFKPSLPYYRINGTSKRWVNMWERCFLKDGEYLAHNYMYDGYTYECGNVYLPPIKKLVKTETGINLKWWNGNDALIGNINSSQDVLIAQADKHIAFNKTPQSCRFSEKLNIPECSVIDFDITLEENSFTEYSCGGIYLEEDEHTGCAILFDTYGKCDIAYIKDGVISDIDDTIGFGSTSLYNLECGKTYHLRILFKNGLYEIYVNDIFLQTFNTAHIPNSTAVPITSISAVATRNSCKLSDIKVYNMNI